ncbi:MAG: DUF5666 domain-containing protein, partial [Gammaproteobacteria bacterium]
MNIETRIRRTLPVVAAVLLAACSGGGSGSEDTAASTPVVAVGAITGFGSVHVNGVRFDTSGATVTLDGQQGTESQLRVGHVVRVEGRLNADRRGGRASSIDFDDAVEGPVQSVDGTAGTLVVLGQNVRVDALTSFDDDFQPASLAGVAIGAIVEVSGFRDANGVIHATRIEREDAAGEFEVTGTVQDHDAAAKRFSIAALIVDYSTAQLDDLPGGAPVDGLLVEVKGRSLDANGVLLATRVEGKQKDMDADDDNEAEIEGLITRFVSPTDFDVNGQRVTTTAATRFENGTSANLALNARVEVEGNVRDGVLLADKVEFEREADLRVSADVGSIVATAGTFTVLGITIQTDTTTRFEDKTDAQVRPFDLAALRVGDFVEVRGSAGSIPNSIAAARVERDDDEDEIELRGPAANVAQPQLTILGVTVMTDAN